MDDTAPQSGKTTPPRRTMGQRLRHAAWRLARILLVMYGLVLTLGCAFQEKLIFPGAIMWTGPDGKLDPASVPGGTLVPLQAGPDKTVGLFGQALTPQGKPHPRPERCPTLLYFYGNGMCLAQCTWEFQQFRTLGANVLIVEFPGYPMAEGSPGEAPCYAAAEAAYAYLRSRPDIDPKKIIPAGWSLGAAVACDVASRHEVGGLIMFSAFTSMDDTAAHTYWFLPVRLLLRHHFRSIDKIPGIKVPILLGHGTADPMIPSRMSLALRDAAKGSVKVKQFMVEGAGHNDFYALGESQVIAELRAFLGAEAGADGGADEMHLR